ncbi:CBS domain-containing protein [Blastopirellula sp. JC732]|uniref:CBS domain-containing protein n=1 Tax=Blastopirellula sediminis TaxID=2894196 RepID=A0A9X1SE60_9BACT|nr:CBS domain-containing protein [Blastopirellula sediminis]MCC9607777.1 CBS domain-containing protein [Blastopirellula sediminis]MCC9627430.1 CBS domain-containing protein [Blastopirellula sediminis]
MATAKPILDQSLSTIVTYNPMSASLDTTLEELLEQVYMVGFHHWPVIDEDRHVVGIISDEDVVRTAAAHEAANMSNRFHNAGGPVRVSEFMSRRVYSISFDTDVASALTLMLEKGINSLPVTEDDRLSAMVTTSDFLREFSFSDHEACRAEVKPHVDTTPVQVPFDASIEHVKFACEAEGAIYAVVMNGDFPLGVVSRRDIRRAKSRDLARVMYLKEDPKSIRASDIIREAHFILATDSLRSAANTMHEMQLQALVVANRQNDLVGILTQEHIMQAML